ncbi:MAG: aromatic ring-hydroxylating dioxygenase subunit alpha [Deltaproteobacteria bacterium]|nr:aromatic ring-hydroxylating dioxygenase subunit alpha [Deltaproteobacteria bacterium]
MRTADTEPEPASDHDGQHFVVRLLDAWYVACQSRQLRQRPISRRIFNTPIVLFRGSDGRPAALLDRCAHRNAPLSLGTCQDGALECPYHGWLFGTDGGCQGIPALCGSQPGRGHRVPRFETQEQQGFVWVYARADVEPKTTPFVFPHVDEPAYATVRYQATSPGTLHANLENILDVPHTAYLHRGLFRGVERNKVTATVRRFAKHAEAEFVGEPVPKGLLGRILAPRGGTVVHFDRFVLPSIAQVDYALGENHVIATTALTPTRDDEVVLNSVITFKTVMPRILIQPLLVPIGKRVLAQDRAMLKAQLQRIQDFGKEQFVSTEVDLLGPHIWRLLRQAARNVPEPQETTPDLPAVFENTVELMA